MKKRALMLLALLAAGMVLVMVAALLPREPRYDGETLSYWMAHWYRGWYGSQALVNPSALAAVKEIGTNGLPYYILWIGKPMRRSNDADYQSRALHAFEVLGPAAKPAIPELIEMLGKGGNQPAMALAYIGKDALPALTNFLATNLLSRVNRSHGQVPAWMAQNNAIDALSYMGTNAETAVPCLIQCLHGGNSATQGEAAAALAVVGRNRPDLVVPALVQAMANTTEYPRAKAAEALGTFETQAIDAVPSLRLVCEVQDAYVKTCAGASLKRILPNDATALLALAQNLTNRNAQVRQQALCALESLGTNGLDALPIVLGASLHDKVAEVRTTAVRCIVSMGECSDEVLAGLIDNLSCTNKFVRSEALAAIARFATNSQPAFNALLKASRSQDKPLREQARSEVTTIGNQNPSLLVTSFDDPDPDVRSRAFQIVYWDVGVEANTAVRALLKALRDDNPRVREAATNTLRNMDRTAAQKAGIVIRN